MSYKSVSQSTCTASAAVCSLAYSSAPRPTSRFWYQTNTTTASAVVTLRSAVGLLKPEIAEAVQSGDIVGTVRLC